MPRQTAQTRADDLVAAFTELGPAWVRWIQCCTPSTAVSYIRMRLLYVLECGGDRTMTALADALAVTPRRVTALVDALEAEGLVERRPHPTDGRSTVVSLTSAGRKQQQTLWAERQREISRAFLDLSAEQQRQLLAITPVLTASLRKWATDRSLPDAARS
jgi:DNA-binding MarR family transcriptional regulator